MDSNNYYNQNTQPQNASNMAMAALVLGIISIVLCSCVYVSIVCGALAIIFALLSRGAEIKMSTNAQIGLILGIVGMVVTTIVTGVALYTIIHEYGSIDAYLKEYSNLLGIDYSSYLSSF